MQVQKTAFGGLTAYVVHQPTAGQRPRLAVVLCHGYGAMGTDLVGLVRPLLIAEPALAEQAVLIFPEAPLDLEHQGLPGGRAWWNIDLDRLINRPTPELLDQYRRACPAGLVESRQLLLTLIEEASQQFGLSAERFLLGGFSQGAMLATDVALRLPAAPAGLVVMSGALINEAQWRPLAMQRGELSVLQSHGRHDSILPFPMAAALRDLLLDAGCDVDFQAFAGDHEIPPPVVSRLAAWIGRHVE
jgi:phospholipase/carboxylesterase